MGLWFHSLGGICFIFFAIDIATVLPLSSYISELWIHYFGGRIFYSTKNIATVALYLFYKLGLWFHWLGGIYLQNPDISIATVTPLSSYNYGSCSHSLEGRIPLYAKFIATVYFELF